MYVDILSLSFDRRGVPALARHGEIATEGATIVLVPGINVR